MQLFHECSSSNMVIQNSDKNNPLKCMIVHLIPRKPNDLKENDELYKMIDTYPKDISVYYAEKMNYYVNAFANKVLEGIHEQTKKYQGHLNICYKEEQ